MRVAGALGCIVGGSMHSLQRRKGWVDIWVDFVLRGTRCAIAGSLNIPNLNINGYQSEKIGKKFRSSTMS